MIDKWKRMGLQIPLLEALAIIIIKVKMTTTIEDPCFWYPNSQECADSKALVVDTTQDGHTSTEVLLGQLTYLGIATFQVVSAVLVAFRYRTANIYNSGTSDFYGDYELALLTGNLWKYADMLNNYSKIVIFGVALITQILSMAGLFASINMLVWSYGVFVAYFSITIVYLLMMGYSYQMAADDYGTNIDANAGVVMTLMKNDFITFFGVTAFTIAGFTTNYTKWYQGQKMATAETEETQAAALFTLLDF